MLDLAATLEVPRRCPTCRTETLSTEPDGERTVFRCRGCGGSWTIQMGYAIPVVIGSSVVADPPGVAAATRG